MHTPPDNPIAEVLECILPAPLTVMAHGPHFPHSFHCHRQRNATDHRPIMMFLQNPSHCDLGCPLLLRCCSDQVSTTAKLSDAFRSSSNSTQSRSLFASHPSKVHPRSSVTHCLGGVASKQPKPKSFSLIGHHHAQ